MRRRDLAKLRSSGAENEGINGMEDPMISFNDDFSKFGFVNDFVDVSRRSADIYSDAVLNDPDILGKIHV